MILSVTLPFFALILFGYIAAARRWVPGEAVPAFNGFLLYFAVPAMLFRFAANTPFDELVNLPFFVAWRAWRSSSSSRGSRGACFGPA